MEERAMPEAARLLITGGAGRVATLIRPHLRTAGMRLRLLDRQPVEDLEADEEAVSADLSDPEALRAAMAGCGAVLHLAGCTTDAPWPEQIADSVAGCANLFEAARAAGVERVVYASSNHAVGFYPRDRRVGSDVTLRPDSRYGVGKAFGELLGAFFADKYGMRVLAIRIGSAEPAPLDRRRLSIWISPRDLAQLVRIGVTHPGLRFAAVYGVSDNARSFYDNGVAEALGYRPLDRAEDHAAAILARDPPPAVPLPAGEVAQGGTFAEAGFVGDPARLREW
ncbi:NAD(P)-dependent oxidoreductase [Roseomonas sp. OT10]|uniref:NAD-dependent epimerase/dehydratase family protein n=1 Tax=Roseomonas cutis TaxID=2897332 RepID=UPI001E38222D|nr:NAD(P)-dependent oxidoreductase [Roseomonas sp. OT10]UFN48278.1 NAD(P)-dependent oxidoreductase [Roseomonas sp. OT10]